MLFIFLLITINFFFIIFKDIISISLNIYDKPNNILITGPNASGKSTFIKSVVLGVLMAQTISIAPTSEMQLTPFKLLNTYLNIPDAKGRESLFEAEMYRARDHINMVYKLSHDDKEFSLVVMDEIFNS